MGLNFTKYSSLITDTAEFTNANDDYLVGCTEAKSVLDNNADWQTQTLLATATSVAIATVTPTSVAPPISAATSTVLTLVIKPPLIDGAKGPLLTPDGSSKVQMKIPYSAPSTSVQVLTYPNVLPIATSAPRNIKFSLPSFVTLATGAMPNGSFQPFYNPPDTTQMTRITGVTTVTSSTATCPSVFPDLVLKLSDLNKQTLRQSLKTLALTVELIFKILECVIKTRNVATDNCNNSGLCHNLSNNNVTHLSFQITRKNLNSWRDRLLNKNVFWMKH